MTSLSWLVIRVPQITFILHVAPVLQLTALTEWETESLIFETTKTTTTATRKSSHGTACTELSGSCSSFDSVTVCASGPEF